MLSQRKTSRDKLSMENNVEATRELHSVDIQA